MYNASRTTVTVTFRSTIVEGEGSSKAFVFAINEGDDLDYSVIGDLTHVSYADGVTTVTVTAPEGADVVSLVTDALPWSTPLARTVSDVTVISTTPDAEAIPATDAVSAA